MVEQFKSLLLLILIGLSLFLTYQLWYGQKPAEMVADDVYEQVDVEAPRKLEDAVVPGRIIIPGDEGAHLFKKGDPDFEKIWVELSALLKSIENDFSADTQNAPPEEAEMCLNAFFDLRLPTGNEMPWLSGLSEGSLDKLELYCLEDDHWLVISNTDRGRQYFKPEQGKLNQVTGVLEDITADDEPDYEYLDPEIVLEELELDVVITAPILVPRDEKSMNRLSLKAENIDQELLLKTFFVDYNLARVIEERDGGRLYTDGEKGLRLTDIGFEFSHPRVEEGQTSLTYSEALRSSSNLISYHGGWPENLRLEDVGLKSREGNLFYEAEWMMYYNGYPLITRQPTRISFNDLGLFRFTRFIFTTAKVPETPDDEHILNADQGQVQVAAWSEALSRALDVLAERTAAPQFRHNLEAMELSYVVTGTQTSPKGTPAWVVIINGEEIILRADDLEVINEEDLL